MWREEGERETLFFHEQPERERERPYFENPSK